jgi:hypothetical protein
MAIEDSFITTAGIYNPAVVFVFENLMRLGVHVQAAAACGIIRKGPWRCSKAPRINQAFLLTSDIKTPLNSDVFL